MEKIKNLFNRIFHRHKNIWKTDLLIIIGFLIIIIIISIWQPVLPDREELNQQLARYGSLGPLAIIGIIILEVIIAPIPGGIIPIVAGALYGVWLGALYSWLGNVIGSIIAFWIAHKLGRPIVKRIISEKKIVHFDNFLQRNKLLIWLVYILPAFPIDIISFVIGLSDIKFKKFVTVVTLGFIPHILILTYFGERILLSAGIERVLFLLGVMIIVVVGFTIEKFILKRD